MKTDQQHCYCIASRQAVYQHAWLVLRWFIFPLTAQNILKYLVFKYPDKINIPSVIAVSVPKWQLGFALHANRLCTKYGAFSNTYEQQTNLEFVPKRIFTFAPHHDNGH